MTYRIDGSNWRTGTKRSITVTARDEVEATVIAYRRGVSPHRVRNISRLLYSAAIVGATVIAFVVTIPV